MRVQDQLISPRYGGPIIGAIRDFITGAFILTQDKTFLKEDEFTNLALLGGYSGPLPEPKHLENGRKIYTGKQLFSLFLPKDFNFVITSNGTRLLRVKAKTLS